MEGDSMRGKRQRYSVGTVTDIDMLYGLKEELENLQARLDDVEAEYRLAKRLMWKHSNNPDEWLFYMGAQTRMIELQEEMECLKPEIEATAAAYLAGVASLMGRFDDGAWKAGAAAIAAGL